MALEKTSITSPDFLPWDATKLRRALDKIQQQGNAASTPRNLLRAAGFYEHLTGYPAHSQGTDLENKVKAMQEEMTTTLYQDNQQAPAMPMAGWQALERGSRELPTPLERGGAAH